jgi:starch phosphorylase
VTGVQTCALPIYYASYVARQEDVAALYQDQESWSRKTILNTANMGKFSSDRTIGEYAKQIWNTTPVKTEIDNSKKKAG